MVDITYFWLKGLKSVGMSGDVELPQFKVLGHRQSSKEVSLTTGKLFCFNKEFHGIKCKGMLLEKYLIFCVI